MDKSTKVIAAGLILGMGFLVLPKLTNDAGGTPAEIYTRAEELSGELAQAEAEAQAKADAAMQSLAEANAEVARLRAAQTGVDQLANPVVVPPTTVAPATTPPTTPAPTTPPTTAKPATTKAPATTAKAPVTTVPKAKPSTTTKKVSSAANATTLPRVLPAATTYKTGPGIDAYWRDLGSAKLAEAYMVVKCESSFNPKAWRSTSGTPGKGDHGLFQVNHVHKDKVEAHRETMSSLFDPFFNARIAREVYDEDIRKGGSGWGPWYMTKKCHGLT